MDAKKYILYIVNIVRKKEKNIIKNLDFMDGVQIKI